MIYSASIHHRIRSKRILVEFKGGVVDRKLNVPTLVSSASPTRPSTIQYTPLRPRCAFS